MAVWDAASRNGGISRNIFPNSLLLPSKTMGVSARQGRKKLVAV